jgi:hypothetical protein
MSAVQDGSAQPVEPRIEAFRTSVQRTLDAASSFEAAATAFVEAFYAAFDDFTLLVRVFAIVPYRRLDAAERAYLGPLHEATPVLTLMGTRGIEPQWNDRRSSQNHRAIPLVSEAFVDEAPMIAKLFAEIGDSPFSPQARAQERTLLDGDWQFVKKTADTDGLFFVGDARTTTDLRGRRVIPAADFVDRYGVRTVFGFGRRAEDGSLAVVIVFSRKALLRTFAQRFLSLVEVLLVGSGSVSQAALFADRQSEPKFS